MTSKNAPNIFDFATSELSQDAFICWLVSWIGCDNDPQLNQYAKEFVAMLFNQAKPREITPLEIGSVTCPERQKYKIDVYFEATIAGETYAFIIEDKTWTRHHSDQLATYAGHIRKEKKFDDEKQVRIYYKTGYLFKGSEDFEPLQQSYAIVDHEKLREFFSVRESTNAIFKDYADRIGRKSGEITKAIEDLFHKNDLTRFEKREAQWEFVYKLALGIKLIELQRRLHNGYNNDGSAWASCDFLESQPIHETMREKIAVRLDRRKVKRGKGQPLGYHLSVRQYTNLSNRVANDQQRAGLRRQKLARLKKFREWFCIATNNASGKLNWGKPTTDNTGKNDSEIAVLFFDDKVNTVSNVLERFPAIQHEFVRKIPASFQTWGTD